MDYGYDEHGNRTHNANEEDEENAEVRSVHSSHNGDEESSQQYHHHHSRADSASSGFSDDVELVMGDAATQSIHQPLVDPSLIESEQNGRLGAGGARSGEKAFLLESRHADGPVRMIEGVRGTAAATSAKDAHAFLRMVSRIPERLRSVALIGSLHHGKTSVLAQLVHHSEYPKRSDEASRCMTLKSHVISTLAGGAVLEPTSRLITLVDTPGHPDLIAEAAAALRLVDCALLCVDVVEGLGKHGEQLLRQAVLVESLPVVLVISKLDRLILDLKLPPLYAYRKIRTIVDGVNNIIASCGRSELLVAPENGSVLFSSSTLDFFFSLETFANKYGAIYPSLDAAVLSQKLWGQVTFDKGTFKKITSFQQKPTFVAFVLEPLYKVIAHAVTGQGHETLSQHLKPLPRTPLEAIQDAVRLFFGNPGNGEALDAVLSVLPGIDERNASLSAQYGLNAIHSPAAAATKTDLADGTTAAASVVAVAPLQRVFDASQQLVAVVRVVSGVLRARKTPVVVIGEYSSEVDPYQITSVEQIYLRTLEDGYVAVEEARAGQIAYVAGLGARSGSHLVVVGGAAAQAVIAEENGDEEGLAALGQVTSAWLETVRLHPYLRTAHQPLIHVGVELKDQVEAARFQRGLDVLLQTSAGLGVEREDTGEVILSGLGELQLDTALHELRRGLCDNANIGVSQPFVTFQESVMDEEGVLAVAGTRKNRLGFTSGTLPRTLVTAMEYDQLDFFPKGTADGEAGVVKLWTTLRRDHGFDALDAKHVIALGPDGTKGPSLLVNDLLEEELLPGTVMPKKTQLSSIRAAFQSVVKTGPLVGGTVRGVGMRLVLAELDKDTRDVAVLSAARAGMKQSLFGARPQLLEPVLAIELMTPPDYREKLGEILQMRRGILFGEEPIPATGLLRLTGSVPAMDSFGLETQLRMLTQGQAFPFFSFHQWEVVPGDPFDARIRLASLEPAKGYQLARDFVLKTRFRKGLPEDIMADVM